MNKLSVQDRQDLEKYVKFFAIKATQIIVQSRLGDKVNTKCKPHSSGTDWFNLAIPDLPEVTAKTKNVLCGQLTSSRLPLCVEISLKTSEGDCMVLETWALSSSEPPDYTARVTHTVYNRMGLLLKSLIAVTRVTPGYKLSRRQSPDSYLICYRIYSGDPQYHVLGEGYNQVRVGQLSTPIGTIQMNVGYRTKMTISPQHSKDIMVKSDHFKTDIINNIKQQQQNINISDDTSTSLSETIKAGAFADLSHKPSHPLLCEDKEIPFCNLLNGVNKINLSTSPPLDNNRNKSNGEMNGKTTQDNNNGNNNKISPTNSRKSSCSVLSTLADDFIMVDLKTPFAGTNSNNDLGNFYRECQSAPQLKTFSEEPSLSDQVSTISVQLEHFEQSQAEYDALLANLLKSQSSVN